MSEWCFDFAQQQLRQVVIELVEILADRNCIGFGERSRTKQMKIVNWEEIK